MMSIRTRKRLQHEKEMKSLRNKMGSHLVWFDSLSLRQKYDLLFAWKSEKHMNRDIKSPKKIKVRKRGRIIEKTIYPTNFKYWISLRRISNRFRTRIQSVRNSAIDIILNQKINQK